MRTLLVLVALTSLPSGALAAGITKGPYFLDVETDRATVVFEVEPPSAARVVLTDPEGEARTLESAAASLHRVALTGLSAGKAYRVRVVVGAASAEGSIRTAPPPGTPARYLVYGDVRTDHAAHTAVVRAMRAEQAELIAHTGDFVEDGSDEGDWRTFFRIARGLLSRSAIAPTMGNHEAYTQEGTEAYRRYFGLRTGRRGAPEDSFLRWGDTLFLLVSSNNAGFGEAQRAYFERVVEEAGADPLLRHRVVVLHAGPFSSGHHGDNEEMKRDGFVDFLRDARVTIVFSGHDHDYERGVARGIPFVVTGGGGAPLYTENSKRPYQLHFEAAHHFLRVESHGEALRVTAIRPSRRILEDCVLEKRAWRCEPRGGARVPAPTTAGGIDLVLVGLVGAVFTGAIAFAWLRRRRAATLR